MQELLYLLLGWLLGLLGPRIVDLIKARYDRKDLATAIGSEARNLQYRIAVTSFLLAQKYGDMSRDYLKWARPHLVSYKGDAPENAMVKLVDTLLESPDDQFVGMVSYLRAEPGAGLSLKIYSSSFLDASLSSIQSFSISYQYCIHEFRNQFSSLNQEIERAIEYHMMTFDSSMSSENHDLVRRELDTKYANLQKMSMRVVDRLQEIATFDQSKI